MGEKTAFTLHSASVRYNKPPEQMNNLLRGCRIWNLRPEAFKNGQPALGFGGVVFGLGLQGPADTLGFP